jgi:DNA-directed RNA polymerase subunit RPC12/RpoP
MRCPKCGMLIFQRPRTTGPHSTSAHLHGHLQTIAASLGYSMSEVKAALKEDCVSWPHVERLGHMVAVSEADVTMAVECDAIEWTHRIAAEHGIKLVEADNG